MLYAIQNCATEWAYNSGRAYADPFNDVELDVVVKRPDGSEQIVPAFWAGDQTWRVRYSSTQTGTHRYRTVCSDASNSSLHGQTGTLEVSPYEGDNPLLEHGPLRVAASGRTFEHIDGTPFFWLADTWWMGFCKRFRWPEDVQELAADRAAKGFSVVQIIAGLYPDMAPFDERGANEAGFPWDREFTRINPAYFDMADLRVAHLVRSGLLPCIVGLWGFFIDFAGPEVVKKHWRYLIARYGAYPVVWCTTGEALMPYYLAEETAEFQQWRTEVQLVTTADMTWLPAEKRAIWSEIMRMVKETDPYGHPQTIHPNGFAHLTVDDPSLVEFNMLHPAHLGYQTMTDMAHLVVSAVEEGPRIPVLVAEVNYEGEMEMSHPETQRFFFWAAVLSGAGGHTYGAIGIWQMNTPEKPYGPSPHGASYGNRPWNEAAQLPGSTHVGNSKRLLERYAWWDFEPHPEWVEPHNTVEDRFMPYAAGIPGQVRIFYLPGPSIRYVNRGEVTITGLEAGVRYRGFYYDVQSGQELESVPLTGDGQGNCTMPKASIIWDWVFVMERDDAKNG
ncbi:MAG: DUF4038 domain-containing protein [Caldilineaceae bacterium]|nr:DUF4038 domain-containing protein [Caldilineaceae bacterium]